MYTADGISGTNLQHFFLDRYRESFINEWAAFIDYVIDGGPSPVPGSAGRAPVIIGQAAWQSVREERPIRIDEGVSRRRGVDAWTAWPTRWVRRR